jgi:hypothetical protein
MTLYGRINHQKKTQKLRQGAGLSIPSASGREAPWGRGTRELKRHTARVERSGLHASRAA